MGTSSNSGVKEAKCEGKGLIYVIFSWSIADLLNKDLYKSKVCEATSSLGLFL